MAATSVPSTFASATAYDLKNPSEEVVDDVTAVPCTTEHEYETFFVGSMPGGAYPTDDSLRTLAG